MAPLNGINYLYEGKINTRSIKVQILGIYRYIADPVIHDQLPFTFQHEVFDLMISDGQNKMKIILSPALNPMVWRGEIAEADVIQITACQVTHIQASQGGLQEDSSYPVCIVTQLVRVADVASLSHAQVPFLSRTHIREYCALPLAGNRLYYLSRTSDDCVFGWYPSASESLEPVPKATLPWIEWSRRRRYCADIFHPQNRIINTIREANVLTTKRKRTADHGKTPLDPPPPLVGIVHFKSKLIHLGTPSTDNSLPFMFHILLSDRTRSVEIALFGSVAVKHFLLVQEGDIVQVRDYVVERSIPMQPDEKVKKLFVLPHLSSGSISHVPEKFYKLLIISNILTSHPSTMNDAKISVRPQLEPSFLTSAHVSHWEPIVRENELDAMYFDVIGLVSYAGPVIREHNPLTGSTFSFRWLKLIDYDSMIEVVIKLYVTSQWVPFTRVCAGDTVVLTKLQWITVVQGVWEYATSSSYSSILLDEDLKRFEALEEYVLNAKFVKRIKLQTTKVISAKATTLHVEASYLQGSILQQYQPQYSLPFNIATFKEALQVKSVTLYTALENSHRLEALEHQHVLIREVRLIRASSEQLEDGTHQVILWIGENTTSPHKEECQVKVLVYRNPLFREIPLTKPVQDLTTPDAIPLVQVLSPSVLKAIQYYHESLPPSSSLTLPIVLQHLRRLNGPLQCSVHFYQPAHGPTEMHLDAIRRS